MLACSVDKIPGDDMTKVRTIVLAATLAMGGQVAHAADYVNIGEQRLSETVTYGDLDLDRSADVSRLYKRLSYAAKHVCAPFRSRTMTESAQHRACVSEALASAISEIDQPLLTQYYNSKGHDSSTIVAQR